MFVGVCCFAGVKKLKSKKGNDFQILRLIDKETGEFCELFLGDEIFIPSELNLFDDVEVSLMPQNRTFRVTCLEVVL